MALPALSPDLLRPPVEVQQTAFSHDMSGRWVCDTWSEAIQNGGRPFDAVVIGGGMHGGYCAQKLYRFGEGIGLRVLVLDAGAFWRRPICRTCPASVSTRPALQQ
jgi:hypothetical protein